MTIAGSGLRGADSGDQRRLQSTAAQAQYLNDCSNTLLNNSVLKDGLISQQTFATAYSGLCKKYAVPAMRCPDGTFDSLPVDIQAKFFEGVCQTMNDPSQCASTLSSLNTMSFGYIASNETMPQLQTQVQGLCSKLVGDVFAVVPTVSPTPSPTSSQTVSFQAPVAQGNNPVGQTGASNSPVNNGHTVGPTPLPANNKTVTNSMPANNKTVTNNITVTNNPTTLPQGSPSPPKANPIKNLKGSFSGGPLIGISVIAIAFCLLLLYVAYRRLRATSSTDEKPQVESDGESTTDSDPEAPEIYPNALAKKRVPSLSHYDVSTGAAAIALKMSTDASSVSRSSFDPDLAPEAKTTYIERVEAAVDTGNWDEVYKLASQLAEQDDLSTLSGAGRKKAKGRLSGERMSRRSRLREEDHERSRNLDELIDLRDWTGVAVTAALYAGGSGYQKPGSSSKARLSGRAGGRRVSKAASQNRLSHIYSKDQSALGAPTVETSDKTGEETDEKPPLVKTDPQLLHLKDSMDYAVDLGDWDQVLRLSSEVEHHGAYQSRHASQPPGVVVSVPSKSTSSDIPSTRSGGNDAFKSLIEEMDRAMSRGDWALVGFYADKIRAIKASGDETGEKGSRALVPLVRPQPKRSLQTQDTAASIVSKKNTLEKLVQAEKWKGVAIMAGLYEMEAKGSLSTDMESL